MFDAMGRALKPFPELEEFNRMTETQRVWWHNYEIRRYGQCHCPDIAGGEICQRHVVNDRDWRLLQELVR